MLARKETDDTEFTVSSVSFLWLERLVEIDATWNPSHWSLPLFERELRNQNSQVLGIFSNHTPHTTKPRDRDSLVGYLIAHTVLDESHIVSLGIDPAWRGRGGGKHLLKEFIRQCRLLSVAVITLDVRVSNTVAQKLYESMGFAAVGVRARYYSSNQEDAISMRLELNLKKAVVGIF